MRTLCVLAAAALAVAIATPSSAVPLPFTATFNLRIGPFPVTASGSGVGNFSGAGGSASIPANVFSIHTTAPINPPLLVIDGFAVGAPGVPTGATAPVPPGSNKALAFGGVTGVMGLNAAFYLLTSVAASPPGFVAGAVPLGMIGVGGTVMFNALGMLIMGTPFANPYQLGMVTVMGALDGVPSTVMATGFDNRTAGGLGVLQLVSPTSFGLGALGSLASVATLSIQIVPEPTTALLLGAGLTALAMGRRRFSDS